MSYRPIGQLVDAVRACASVEGSVGVIVPDARAADVQRRWTAPVSGPRRWPTTPTPRSTVVPATSAKGLEFDSVVLLEPAAIVAAEPERPSASPPLRVADPGGLAAVVVHDEPLPAELAG